MNNELKRRTFIGVAIGTLAVTPFVGRMFRKKNVPLAHRFTDELKKYRDLANVPVKPTSGPSTFRLSLTPKTGSEMRYVLFAPSHFPKDVSYALGDEPDEFLAREGTLIVEQSKKGQVVILGQDRFNLSSSPLKTEDRDQLSTRLLVKDDKLALAKPKGTEIPQNLDTQFLHLLALEGLPVGDLAVGQKWTAKNGRVKPFDTFTTNYEITGFSEIAGRKTVQVRFTANTPNLAQLPGVNVEKPAKDQTMTNKHTGNAWFDLESGLLVRQETEMQITAKNVKGYVNGTKPKDFVVTSNTVIQLS